MPDFDEPLDLIDPDRIARRRFAVTKRGFDQHEVLAFLNQLTVALMQMPVNQSRAIVAEAQEEAMRIRAQAQQELAAAQDEAQRIRETAVLDAQGARVSNLERIHGEVGAP
jgi:DivIVA domain-containing protein